MTILQKLAGVKPKSGGGHIARCPAHEDRQASLSIDVRDGKVLLRCFAGCSVNAIVAALGLTMADLRLEPRQQQSRQAGPVTVESLAASKGLPVELLRRYGVRTIADMTPAERLERGIDGASGVWIPYFNLDGSIAGKTRIRSAHVAKDGSRWSRGLSAVLPYGLHELEAARSEGLLCLCEGESDFWSLRAMGVPALGLPGANMVKVLRREHLAGVAALYVLEDADKAGASFVASVRQHVAAWGLLGVVSVSMPAGCKDVNDLYRRDPKGAADTFSGLLAAAAAAGAPAPREFSTAGEIYTLTAPDLGLRLELDQIRRAWGDLVGELAVSHEAIGDISRSTVNLSSLEKRQRHAGELAKRAQLPEVDFPALIEDFAIRCLRAEREGSPGVWLDEIPPRPADRVVSAIGFEIPIDLPSCLFGDGDTGKSYLALRILGEIARQGIRCGIVDAEMEGGIHRERLSALFGDEIPRIAYWRAEKPLALSVDAVRRFVRDYKLDYLVFDSVGFLTPEPEKSESALSYMRAVRQIGLGSLSIAHVTKNGELKPEQQKPFGSNFYYQSFRRIWYAQAEAEADPSGRKVIGIWDRKANTARKRPPFGLALTVREGWALVEPADLGAAEGLAEKLPLRRRLERLLAEGPATVPDLAEALEVGERGIRQALDRGNGTLFTLVPGSRPARWVLLERNQEDTE